MVGFKLVKVICVSTVTRLCAFRQCDGEPEKGDQDV